jgi:hypothetical protein
MQDIEHNVPPVSKASGLNDTALENIPMTPYASMTNPDSYLQ